MPRPSNPERPQPPRRRGGRKPVYHQEAEARAEQILEARVQEGLQEAEDAMAEAAQRSMDVDVRSRQAAQQSREAAQQSREAGERLRHAKRVEANA